MNKLTQLPKLDKILDLKREELECLALDLQSELPEIDQYCALYKLKFLIENRMQFLKDKALEGHLRRFEGSSKEGYNGFTVQIKVEKEYQFSDKVNEMETDKKKLGGLITAQKNLEKQDGTAKLINEKQLLTLTME